MQVGKSDSLHLCRSNSEREDFAQAEGFSGKMAGLNVLFNSSISFWRFETCAAIDKATSTEDCQAKEPTKN